MVYNSNDDDDNDDDDDNGFITVGQAECPNLSVRNVFHSKKELSENP